jgi:hypothetical protein
MAIPKEWWLLLGINNNRQDKCISKCAVAIRRIKFNTTGRYTAGTRLFVVKLSKNLSSNTSTVA